MKHFLARTILLSILTCSSLAFACSPPDRSDTFVKRLEISTNVFVFRLVNSRLVAKQTPGGEFSEHVEGDIQFVKSLRGGSIFRKVVFPTGWCGGLRLDVGHFYIAATTQKSGTLKLAIYDPSILNIGNYYRDPKDVLEYSAHIEAVARAIQGKPYTVTLLSENSHFTQSYPPLPPEK